MDTKKQRGGVRTKKTKKSNASKRRSFLRRSLGSTLKSKKHTVKSALGLNGKILSKAIKYRAEELQKRLNPNLMKTPIESLETTRDTIKSMRRMYKKLSKRGTNPELQENLEILLLDLSDETTKLFEKYTHGMNENMNNWRSSFNERLHSLITEYSDDISSDLDSEGILNNTAILVNFLTDFIDAQEDEDPGFADEYDIFALELSESFESILKKHVKEISKIKQELYRGLVAPNAAAFLGAPAAPRAAAPANAEDNTINELLGKLSKLGF